MQIPYSPFLFDHPINIHLIFELLAFFLGFKLYQYLKRRKGDMIEGENRLFIILGATVGALLGSRVLGYLEQPVPWGQFSLLALFQSKTIVGALLGGLVCVEVTKKILGERHSSGDLFALPLCLGIFIGRIGCFLSGTLEPTFGRETTFFMGMDLGDGLLRHPVALYEMFFLALLAVVLYKAFAKAGSHNGNIFKSFMVAYLTFRFLIDCIKPQGFELLHLTTIQWACMLGLFYYLGIAILPRLDPNHA